jgi:hypothetical protein
MLLFFFSKRGRSANKFWKSQIRKFADLLGLLIPQMRHVADLQCADPIFFVICGLVICGFSDPSFVFCGLKTSVSPQIFHHGLPCKLYIKPIHYYFSFVSLYVRLYAFVCEIVILLVSACRKISYSATIQSCTIAHVL